MNMSSKKLLVIAGAVILSIVLLAACGGGGSESTVGDDEGGGGGSNGVVKIGGIFDETGATGDVGAPYADGARSYVEYINSQGGIDGVNIELISEDYAYDISRAQQIYQSLRDRHDVSAIIGWGTGDTEALRSQIIADQIPYFSGSLSENLKDTESESGFNYLVAASYSDQGRAVLEWIRENHEGDFPVTLALVYEKGNPFSESPMQDIKDYAAEQMDGEIEIVNDILIELSDNDPLTTLQAYERNQGQPDYAITQYTWGQTRNVVRDAHNLEWNTQFIGLNWAGGEGIVPSGADNQQWVEALDGFMATITHAFPYEDLPGMEPILQYLESKGRSIEDDDVNQKFVQGWVTMSIFGEAIRIALEDYSPDEIDGVVMKEAIEQIDDLDLGGLAANVSFSPDNHAGTDRLRLGQLRDGQWEIIQDYFGISDYQ